MKRTITTQDLATKAAEFGVDPSKPGRNGEMLIGWRKKNYRYPWMAKRADGEIHKLSTEEMCWTFGGKI